MHRATSYYEVDLRPPPIAPKARPAGRVLRVARLLALAHAVDARIRSGELRDLADAARLLGVTRGRMTQITNLVLLAPAIQAEILEWPMITEGRDPVTERVLRQLGATLFWEEQIALWKTVTRNV